MKAGIKSSARAERVAASDKLQLHEKPSYLRRSRAIAGEGRPTKRWIARDERKFPAEVLRQMANKSVTSVTNGSPSLFYDFHHNGLVFGGFLQHPGRLVRFAMGIAEIAVSR